MMASTNCMLRVSALAIATLFAGSAAAVDFSTSATVDVVAGIVITETTPMDFGSVAKADGDVVIAPDGTLGDTDNIVFDETGISNAVLSIQANDGAVLTITITAGSMPNGLSLGTFMFSAAGGPATASGNPHTMLADTDALLIGATLTVVGADAGLGTDIQLPYTVTAVYP